MNSADHRGVAALNELETNEQTGHSCAPEVAGALNVGPEGQRKDTAGASHLSAAPQPVQTAEDELAALPFEEVLKRAYYYDEKGEWRGPDAEEWTRWHAVARAALASKPVQGGEQSGKWEGAEEWMPLAWELCANECGEDACTELIWEGGPIPEPWGDRWLKYEGQAREMIAMVRKHVPALAAQPVREPMSVEQADAGLREAIELSDEYERYAFRKGVRFAERHHGITKE